MCWRPDNVSRKARCKGPSQAYAAGGFEREIGCFGAGPGHLTHHGGTRVVEAMVTQVAQRADGAWRFVAFQITPKREAADSRR